MKSSCISRARQARKVDEVLVRVLQSVNGRRQPRRPVLSRGGEEICVTCRPGRGFVASTDHTDRERRGLPPSEGSGGGGRKIPVVLQPGQALSVRRRAFKKKHND